ncbi:TlpA family protein disulfide reductase [Sorangium sp. So ce131]|uniref:TlpA family protein disulfide reductase n=1 Tax=Sorangium sp. So ce131 TaxID=3133282 RepID=UPI003F60C335
MAMPVKWTNVSQILFILAAAVGVYSFVHAAQNDQRTTSCEAMCAMRPAYAGRNRIAPDFELPDMNGNLVRLSSFRGKTVFLNFWTKTCGPCLEEMPALAELGRIARGRKDFVVLTVSTDAGPDDVRDTLKVALNGDPPFPILFDPESKVVMDQYGTQLFPETWVIDPNGIIRARFDGARDWSSSLAIDVGEMVSRWGGCPVEFYKSQPRGSFAALCGDDS